MLFDKVVAHMDDIVDGELGGAMGIQHCRVVDMLPLLGYGGFDGEQMDVDLGHVHCRKLGRKGRLGTGLNAVFVDKAGNLNTCLCGEVGNKGVIFVDNVAADLIGNVGDNGFHYIRGVFACAGVAYVACNVHCALFVPTLDLFNTAAGIFVQRNAVALDKLGVFVLDEEIVVLGVVLGGLGAVVAEAANVLKADKVVEVFGGIVQNFAGSLADEGEKVCAVGIFKLNKPAHVVDARNSLANGLRVAYAKLA